MKRLFIITILFLFFSAANAFGAVSTFNLDNEGWALVTLDYDDPTDSTSAGMAGYDSDGYIFATDGPNIPSGLLAFSAPAEFLGDKSEISTFSFEINSYVPSFTRVIFVDSGQNYLAGSIIGTQMGTWQSISITVYDEASWYYNSLGNATLGEIDSVLENLTAVYILADTMFFPEETTYLDNVTMSRVPVPGSILLLGSGVISLFAFRKRKN